jgi:hypothetical protein
MIFVVGLILFGLIKKQQKDYWIAASVGLLVQNVMYFGCVGLGAPMAVRFVSAAIFYPMWFYYLKSSMRSVDRVAVDHHLG